MFNISRLLALIAATLPITLLAAEPRIAEKQIQHLMTHLGSSGCQFNRNGTWYSSKEAVSHLSRKYDYLRKKQLAPTAEAFIERAATSSSVSGKPYLVKCGDGASVASAAWLRAELEKLKATTNSY
jgi:hypothetical protein